MIKRILCWIPVILMLVSLCGCTSKQKIKNPVLFYYPKTNITYGGTEQVIQSEPRESFGKENNWRYLLEEYLHGPISDQLQSPFPPRLEIVTLSFTPDTLTLVLSKSITYLSAADLTIACTSLALTCMDMTGVKVVKIQADNVLLNGRRTIEINRDSVQHLDLACQNSSAGG